MIEQYLAWAGFSNTANPDDPMVKGGQVAYATPGTYIWTVPEGVTSISVVVVSAGQQGRAQAAAAVNAGRGGSVRWKNNIPVVPGETYTLVVGSGGIAQSVPSGTASEHQTDYASSAFGLFVGVTSAESTPKSAEIGGGDGAGGGSGTGQTFYGGNSASFNGDNSVINGQGITLLNVVSPRSGINGGPCGGGGGAIAVSSGNRSCGKGGDGGIRIMWGNGRAYPGTQIADRP